MQFSEAVAVLLLFLGERRDFDTERLYFVQDRLKIGSIDIADSELPRIAAEALLKTGLLSELERVRVALADPGGARALQGDRGAHPQGDPARRSSGHGQDHARAGGRWRGRRLP